MTTPSALAAFASHAGFYLNAIENHAGRPMDQLLQQLERQLLTLYAGILEIPLAFPEDDRPDDPLPAGRERLLEDALSALFGPADNYRVIFDPYDSVADQPVIGSLANDLIGIYGDLYRGLRRWEAGDTEEASYEWRFGFQYHWGRHLAFALQAIFALQFAHSWEVPPLAAREA